MAHDIPSGAKSMQALHTIWATLVELTKNVQSLPSNPKSNSPQSQNESLPQESLLAPTPNEAPDIPPVSPQAFNEFLSQHPSLMYKYVFKVLKKAIRDDKESVILFNMPHLDTRARIDRKDYPIALERAIEHFLKSEEYERIRECQTLLEQHYVNEIIRSSAE
jgi:hypothetical protein